MPSPSCGNTLTLNFALGFLVLIYVLSSDFLGTESVCILVCVKKLTFNSLSLRPHTDEWVGTAFPHERPGLEG